MAANAFAEKSRCGVAKFRAEETEFREGMYKIFVVQVKLVRPMYGFQLRK